MFDKTRVIENTNISWPALMDMSSADCRRLLRQNEIEAYSKVVSAFRAQGLFTSEKKSVLSDLRRLLNICGDRHRAEVRRAVNDDELATISECVSGKRTDDSWYFEGRRITPIIQRGVPQTAFLLDADAVAIKIASFKFMMPNKSKKLPITADCAQTDEKADSVSFAEAVENVNKVKNVEDVPNADVVIADLPKSVSNDNENDDAPVVPEAAVEVTCEADATPKSKFVSTVIEEKASLIAELPVDQFSKDKTQPSISSQLDENAPHSPPLIKQIPIIQSVISGFKRPHSVLESPDSLSSSQAKLPLSTSSFEGAKNGGTVPFVSTTRNFLIRPNTLHIPTNSVPKPLSQGNQMNKVQGSSNPVLPIPTINRSSPSSTLTSTPSLTTFVMTGSSGPTAFISQSSNTASRVFKNYSTVISSNQQQQNSLISSSASENRKMHPAHSIIVQSSQLSNPKPLQTTNSSIPRNVYFVPQGPANRLVTSSSTVGSTNQPSTSRPLRILPVNNSLITTSKTATNTNANSSTLGPLLTSANLPSNYQNQQNNSGVCGESELPSPAVNLVKVAAAPVNIGYSPCVGSLLVNSPSVNISTTSQQVSSPSQLVSMLDPKRPRLAFMSTASPSTRQ
nr:protein EMSY [Hymenolepis microstoma]